MASRRVGQKAIDWAAFAERVPPNQKSQFNHLKGRYDALKARYNATPEKPVALDWEMYRKTITVPGLVDKFEKQFAATTVPYPKDTISATIDAQEKDLDTKAADWKVQGEKRIAEYKQQYNTFADMVPFEEMTVEEFDEYFPELSVAERRKKYPFWPHQPPAE